MDISFLTALNKAREVHSKSKKMLLIVSFSYEGVLCHECASQDQTINSLL